MLQTTESPFSFCSPPRQQLSVLLADSSGSYLHITDIHIFASGSFSTYCPLSSEDVGPALFHLTSTLSNHTASHPLSCQWSCHHFLSYQPGTGDPGQLRESVLSHLLSSLQNFSDVIFYSFSLFLWTMPLKIPFTAVLLEFWDREEIYSYTQSTFLTWKSCNIFSWFINFKKCLLTLYFQRQEF